MALVLNPQYAVAIRRPVVRQAPSARSGTQRSSSVALPTRVSYQSTSLVRPTADVYRRRRRVAVALIITFAAAACLGVRALASRGDVTASIPTVTPMGSSVLYTEVGQDVSGAYVHGPQYYVVQEGDTMWSIASSLVASSSESGDIRSMVRALIALNGQAGIDVGQRLTLPES